MPLAAGSKLGSYDIVAPLGAGGMGEVYRARDTKLGREVAVKVLPASFTDDPDRVARFQREAQLLAALNHPNIAAIYGLEQSETTPFLVLELVEGETLAERLGRPKADATGTTASASVASGRTGGLDLDEAIAIARQIADALEAAHEKGIIHRDLKPANIAVNADGMVKVLDFGLAKAMERGDSERDGMTHSPTITFAATQAGVILGTAAYMSPEQAKGRAADKRTDVWAFGCVLFEMLTARRAFEGEDVTEVIAAIVRGEPEWSALPANVPEQIRLLIRRCLDKDRRARVSDIGVARFLMNETIAAAPAPAAVPQVPPRSSARRMVAATVGGIVAGAGVTALAAWAFLRPPPAPARHPARFPLILPAAQRMVLQGADRNVDITPDGTVIVYRGAGAGTGPQIWVRALNDLEARPLSGTNDSRTPFVSPDGRWIGFFDGQLLKKVQVSGGPPVTLCRVPSPPRGAAWTADGTIVFATSDPNVGLLEVSANGGEPKTLIKPAAGTGAYGFPASLPDGRHLLFTIGAPGSSPEAVNLAQIAVLDRQTGDHKILIRGGSHAHYVPGFLVYATGGALRAVRFDADRQLLLGDPVPMVEQVLMTPQGAANYAVTSEGTLLYVPSTAGAATATPRTLVWVNRDGREEPLRLPSRPYEGPRLSPDGTRIATAIFDDQLDIWIGDVARETLTRLSFEPTTDQTPVWTPDGRRVIWSAQGRGGTPHIVMQSADGTGTLQRLSTGTQPTFATTVTRDGAYVAGWENHASTRQDIVRLEVGPASADQEPRRVQPLVHTPAVEVGAEISQDGQWLAYESDESGRAEVYVRPFPNVDVGRWQISTAGGTRPAWARSGRELFYIDSSGFLMSVSVTATGSTFAAGNPAKVLDTKYYPGFTGLGLNLRGYDVAPDGRRFLMLKEAPAGNTAAGPSTSMVVVINWLQELEARIPAK